MTRLDHEIRRAIMIKIQARIAVEKDRAIKAYFLGLEAGELMKGAESGSTAESEALQRNFEQAWELGIIIDLNQ